MVFGDSFLTQGPHLNIWNILNILVHSSSNRFEMSNQPSGKKTSMLNWGR